MPYSLRVGPALPHEPCQHCAHPVKQHHSRPDCPGLNESAGGCLTVHFFPDSQSHLRCQNPKGWTVEISLSIGNNRLYRAREDKEGGLRCRTCAGHHAEMLNISVRAAHKRAA